MRPIVEFMFADFMPTAGDAIVNQLPKYRFMSGGQFSVPGDAARHLAARGGRFGTQHSATGESWYMAQPGMRVAVAGTPAGAYELLRAAIRGNDPVIVHEHKVLYGRKGPVRRGAIAEIGKASVERAGSDVTIVASLADGRARRWRPRRQLAEEGIEAEVIDLRWVRPLDMDTIGGIGREDRPPGHRRGAVARGRLGRDDHQPASPRRGPAFKAPPAAVSLPDDLLIPYSPPLEDEFLPSADRIAEVARASVRS